MATGACGINCDACRLSLIGLCSTCGPGTSEEAAKKVAAQTRILGQPCAIVDCACTNQLQHCPRDCRLYPCENFKSGPHPFSEGYLKMQERRRRLKPTVRTPTGEVTRIPEEYWDDIAKRDIDKICAHSLAFPEPPDGLVVRFLNRDLVVDIAQRCLKTSSAGSWETIEDPFLELMTLVYLLNAADDSVANEMIGVQDLKEAHFFQGPHALPVDFLLKRYGSDLEGFKQAALKLDGKPLDMADAAFRFRPFPKIPLYYLLREGDKEFQPSLSILFDRTIECHLPADAIWGVIKMVNKTLLIEDMG